MSAKEYQMGSGRKINDEFYTLLTTAKDKEGAEELVRVFEQWLTEGHKVTYIEDEDTYLIYVKRPPELKFPECLYGAPLPRHRPIYVPRKKSR